MGYEDRKEFGMDRFVKIGLGGSEGPKECFFERISSTVLLFRHQVLLGKQAGEVNFNGYFVLLFI